MSQPEYQFVESNPDPHFRPSISALVTKLRKLNALKNQPASVEFVAYDLIYQYLYNEKPRPSMIWRLLLRLEALWRMSLRQYVQEVDKKDRILPDGSLQTFPYAEDETLLWRMLQDPQRVPVLIPEDAEPSVVFVEPAHPNEEDFKSERLKEGVQQVIFHHRLVSWTTAGAECKCGKTFTAVDGSWKWAKHLRIQIWRYMLQEFIYDGQVQEVQGQDS